MKRKITEGRIRNGREANKKAREEKVMRNKSMGDTEAKLEERREKQKGKRRCLRPRTQRI